MQLRNATLLENLEELVAAQGNTFPHIAISIALQLNKKNSDDSQSLELDEMEIELRAAYEKEGYDENSAEKLYEEFDYIVEKMNALCESEESSEESLTDDESDNDELEKEEKSDTEDEKTPYPNCSDYENLPAIKDLQQIIREQDNNSLLSNDKILQLCVFIWHYTRDEDLLTVSRENILIGFQVSEYLRRVYPELEKTINILKSLDELAYGDKKGQDDLHFLNNAFQLLFNHPVFAFSMISHLQEAGILTKENFQFIINHQFELENLEIIINKMIEANVLTKENLLWIINRHRHIELASLANRISGLSIHDDAMVNENEFNIALRKPLSLRDTCLLLCRQGLHANPNNTAIPSELSESIALLAIKKN